jgi:predicted RNase H-like nuclease (RuvC/YqgF family)
LKANIPCSELEAPNKYNKVQGYEILKHLINKALPEEPEVVNKFIDKIDELKFELETCQAQKLELESNLAKDKKRSADLEKKCEKIVECAKKRTDNLRSELKEEQEKMEKLEEELYQLKRKYQVLEYANVAEYPEWFYSA